MNVLFQLLLIYYSNNYPFILLDNIFYKEFFLYKKRQLLAVIFKLVTRTGFEPMNACVKGM